MTTLSERIKECFDEKSTETGKDVSILMSELAKICEIKTPSIYDWLNGKTKRLNGMNLIRAGAFFEVQPEWLDSGVGEKRGGLTGMGYLLKKSLIELRDGKENPPSQVVFEPVLMKDNSSAVTSDDFVEVYLLLNHLGAGGGAILEDYDMVSGRLAYRRDWLLKRGLSVENLRILPVKGTSMEPYVFDGNKVVVNTADKRIIDGEHYAIRVGDQAKVKRLFKQPDGKIRVESYNAITEFIGPGDDAEVLGHVVDRKGTSNANGA